MRHCCSVNPWARNDGRKCRITASRARNSAMGSERENSRIGVCDAPVLLAAGAESVAREADPMPLEGVFRPIVIFGPNPSPRGRRFGAHSVIAYAATQSAVHNEKGRVTVLNHFT